MTDYQEAIDWIHSREKFKVKPGLKRMEWMMERLGHPEQSLKAIHIAGTNGKGSTVSFIRHLLQKQGYNVGTFTSPYIVRFNERISVNGEPIEDYELADLVQEVKPLTELLAQTTLGEPTEFEVITVLSMVHFSRRNLDFVLFETGLGGRYDSTNIIKPLISIITTIGMDHIDILGTTLEQIAEEKAGIIKEGIPVITGVSQYKALKVINDRAKKLNSPIYVLGEDFHVDHLASTFEGENFIFSNGTFRSVQMLSRMKGAHQVDNVAVALQTIELLKEKGAIIQRHRYAEAIEGTTWPARFETIHQTPLTIIDGAHNEEGTRALVQTVQSHFEERKVFLVYSALNNKPVEGMLETLGEVVDEAYFTTFDFPRARSAEDLLELSPIQNSVAIDDYREAVQQAIQRMDEKNDLLLITGSLYFISEIRKYFEFEINL